MQPMESLERKRFTIEELEIMARSGVFDEQRVELVDGDILVVNPQGPLHRALKDDLAPRLTTAYGQIAHVAQGPLVIGRNDQPEPDLAVVRGRALDYSKRHPRGADVLLVIEISVTSRLRDRKKARIYARGGVPVYWRIDLDDDVVEVYTRPDAKKGYTSVRELSRGDRIALPDIDREWDVSSLLR